MDKLYSIQTSDKVFETGGSRPILVTCNDMNAYVCKYISSSNSVIKLAYEFIAASFLKLWELKVPDFALVTISRDHIPPHFDLRNPNFNITCFGSKYSRDYADMNNFVDLIDPKQRKSYPSRNDLFYISLFDIWLANEDRTHNNYNLLVDINNQRNFIPIDHDNIFNSRSAGNMIYELTYEDSLVYTPLFRKMFSKKEIIQSDKEEIETYFYTFVNHCLENLVYVISQLPDDWKINKKELETKMIDEIFNEAWLKKSFKLLLSFLQYNSNIK